MNGFVLWHHDRFNYKGHQMGSNPESSSDFLTFLKKFINNSLENYIYFTFYKNQFFEQSMTYDITVETARWLGL